jgi:phage/plasmid-related protein TIGR03299
MAHDLFGERFIGSRVAAWHQLGIVVPDNEQITTSEAFKRAGLGFKYHTLPIGVTLPTGEFVQTNDEMAVYREPTPDDPEWRSLGIVSSGYQYLQNEELAEGIDAIAENTGWKFETAGALGQGETIFACLKTGKHSVHGDEMDSYLLITDGKAANRALRIIDTTVRVVCRNTLMRAESDNSMNITVPHASGVEQEYRFWLDLISNLIKSQEDTLAELRVMGDVKITDEIAKRIFESAFPFPTMNQRVKLSKSVETMSITDQTREKAKDALSSAVVSYEYNMRQAEKWQSGALNLYRRFNDGAEQGGQMSKAALEKLRETPYAALQAVTEICDFGGTNRDSVASATLFGARAAQKSRAWASALRIANSSLN